MIWRTAAFLKRAAKLGSFTYSTKFFCQISKIFFSFFYPEFLKNLSLFSKRTAKIRGVLLSAKFFFPFSLTHFPTLINICHSPIYCPSAKNWSDSPLSFFTFSSSQHLPFNGVCFKSGCKDKQLRIAAKYFCIFFSASLWNAVPERVSSAKNFYG